MIAFQRSKLPADYHNKKEAVSPQAVFCGDRAGTKWQSGYARLDMHLVPCSFSMSIEGRHILEEVQEDFMRYVDARAIVQKARIKEIIPEAVEIQINESNSSDVAKNVLLEHLQNQVMLESLRRFCSIMIESKGYERMQCLERDCWPK